MKQWMAICQYLLTDPIAFLNDDIALGLGQLAAIRETIASKPEGWFFVGRYYWSVWAISRAGAEAITAADGYLFDEAIFPAYFEDNDFYHRFTSRFPDRYIAELASFEPDVQRNSASCAKDSTLNARFATNRDYYICKWGGPPGEERRTPEMPLSIDFCYETFCARPSDIYEHLPALRNLAEKCDHITELGVRTVVSTWAFLMARPRRFACYDILEHPNISVAARLAAGEGIEFEFFNRDVLKIEIEETDLLFIDTLHTYTQLLGELVRHSRNVRKSIVMHDTVSYGHRDEVDDGVVIAKRGLVPAIVDFLNSADGSGWEHYGTDIGNNGLTVLVRKGGAFDPDLD